MVNRLNYPCYSFKITLAMPINAIANCLTGTSRFVKVFPWIPTVTP